MNKLIIMIQPFMAKQTIYVYEDNVKIDAIQADYKNFTNSVIELTRKYATGDVEIIGPENYTKGLGNQILKSELEKYNKNIINITYKGLK